MYRLTTKKMAGIDEKSEKLLFNLSYILNFKGFYNTPVFFLQLKNYTTC